MSVLGTVAAAVTYAFVPGAAALQWAALAYSVGSGIDAYRNQPDRIGPRLDDLRTQMSVYGNPIPSFHGVYRTAGTVIWPSVLEAVEHEQTESAKGSGPEQKTYSYTMSFAVLVCRGEIAGIRRIWANKKLIYDVSTSNEGATRDPAIGQIRIYNGTETQEVDPLIEATDGESPAYLGYAYAMFEDYDVTEMNGRPPQFEFEVVSVGSEPEPEASSMGDAGRAAAYDPNTGYIWSVEGASNSHIDVYVTDVVTESLIEHLVIVPSATAASMGNDITYIPSNGEFWVANENGTDIIAINSITYASREINLGRSWYGLIHYCPTHGQVVLGSTNTSTNLWVIDVATETLVKQLSFSGGVFGIDQIVTLENGFEAVLYRDNVSICDINGVDSSVLTTHNNAAINTTAVMVEDTSRNRLVILNETDFALIELDLGSGIFTTHNLELPEDFPISASDSLHRVMWHSENDKYYATGHSAGNNWTLFFINPDTFEVEDAREYFGPTNVGTMVEVPSEQTYFVYIDGGSNEAWKIPVQGSLDPTQVSLASIVSSIWGDADLDAADIDVTALTDLVDGYGIPRQMTARAATEPLQTAYYFDVVESDDKIKCVKRGSATITEIPMEDRAAHVDGQELPAHLEIRRAFETELPVQVDIEYPDVDADHQIGNQYDRRITKDNKHKINLQLAIAMTAAKAKEISRVVLYDAWQGTTFRWCTTRKYAYLEPTDRVSLPTDDATYSARITNRRDHPNGIIEWEGKQDAVEVYTQTGEDAVTTPYPPQTVFQPSTTVLELLDSPIFRDEDQGNGFYIAMCGTTASWPGAEVFRSADEGSTYNSILTHAVKTPIGTATTALANFTGGTVFDDGNTVTVRMIAGATLTSYTAAQVLEGYGVFALGADGRWEIVHYTTAILVAEDTYELSGLLRGRRGTEWAMSTHEVGDAFIFGSETAWRLYGVPSSDLNIARRYKAPAYRTKLSDAAYQDFTDRAVRRRPYSVAHLKAEPLNDGGYTISWIHRSLINSSWSTGFSVPLDATFEAFNVTISSIDGVVVRQFDTTTEAFPYAASEIESDFGAIPPAFKIRVAQKNTDYGAGVGASIRSDDATVIYDFDDPFSGDYVPPDDTAPPETPDDGSTIPAQQQWFGPDFSTPAIWDGTKFVASEMYQKATPSGGAYWTSTDGLNYTQLASNSSGVPLGVVAYAGGTYVNQYSTGQTWSSTNLTSWTQGSYNSYPSGYPYDSGKAFTAMIHDGSQFVAVRVNGEIVTSSDGVTWDHRCNVTTPTDSSGYFAGNGLEVYGIAFGNGVYVTVGLDPSSAATMSDRIWTSATVNGPYTARDGAPVSSFSGAPDAKAFLYSVSFCDDDNYFYALGAKRHYLSAGYFVSTAVIIRSTDGVTWTDVTPTPVIAAGYTACTARQFHKLTSDYVVIGTNAYYISTNGSTWTETALAPYNRNQLMNGASNGSILATQEYQWNNVNHLDAGVVVSRTQYYRKAITFDGSVFDPTLDSPYP